MFVAHALVEKFTFWTLFQESKSPGIEARKRMIETAEYLARQSRNQMEMSRR
jgi:hypothetical protein